MAKIEFPEVMPECPICKGSGYIWGIEIPGLRKRCVNCDGTGGIKRCLKKE